MIKYIKSVSFYKNGSFLESVDLEKRSFYTEDEAIEHLINNPLNYYYNKFGIHKFDCEYELEVVRNTNGEECMYTKCYYYNKKLYRK